MSDNTKIEWTDSTWNPIVGCSKISEGCKNCYAERMANRLSHMELSKPSEGRQQPYSMVIGGGYFYKYNKKGWGWHGSTVLVESALEKPLHWKKPRKIFVCSMGDLFHESVPFEWIEKVTNVIARCPQHTFQLLTKRPKRSAGFWDWMEDKLGNWTSPANLWLGVTAENQQRADERLPVLLSIPAAVKFVSCEPLLEEMNIERYLLSAWDKAAHDNQMTGNENRLDELDWVIVGAETGAGARPMSLQWARDIKHQCEDYNTPFFFKKAGKANGNTPDDLNVRESPLGRRP